MYCHPFRLTAGAHVARAADGTGSCSTSDTTSCGFLRRVCLAAGVRVALLVHALIAMPSVTAQTAANRLPEKPPELLGTREMSFEIPFTVDASGNSVVQAILHVSADRGQTWQRHSSQPPTSRAFPFTAPGEGEYWFAIQTVNRDGTRSPSDQHLRSGLRIVVDRVLPELQFDVRPDAAGRVVASIKAVDSSIDPRSLVIEYQVDGSAEAWTAVPATSNRSAAGGVFHDELAFWPTPPATNLAIRATIRDLAGNPATAVRRLNLSAASPVPVNGAPAPVAAAPPQPAGNPNAYTHYLQTRLPVALENQYGAPDPHAVPERQAARPESSDPPPPAENNGDKDSSDSLSQGANAAPQPPATGPRLAENTLDGNNTNVVLPDASSQASQWRSRTAQSPMLDQQRTEASTAGWQPPAEGASGADNGIRVAQENSAVDAPVVAPTGDWPTTLNRLPAPVQQPVRPPVPSPGDESRNAVWSSSTTGAREVPPQPASAVVSGARFDELKKTARHSRSRQFQLDYEVDAVGPEGVRAIELWMSTDGGSNWRRVANDEDRRSPFDVSVDTEGIFGFRIRIVSNEGISAREPRAGDPADLWVNVDTTVPEAAITAAPYGVADDAGKLVVQWQASDANLTLRPIRLQYSPAPGGPWTTIEEGLRNTGEYAWKPALDTPDVVYLRLEARDDAGNVRVDQPARPIDLSGLIPRGHIRGLTPIGVDGT